MDETLNQLQAADAARQEAAANVKSAEASLRAAHANVQKSHADAVAAGAAPASGLGKSGPGENYAGLHRDQGTL